MGPRVARRMHDSDQREDPCGLFRLDNLKRRANARPTRSGPVRQDSFFQVIEPDGEIKTPGGEVAGGDEAENGVLNLGGEIGEGKAGAGTGKGVELVEAELVVDGKKRAGEMAGAGCEGGVEGGCDVGGTGLLREDAAEKRAEGGKLREVERLGNVDGTFVDKALQASKPGELDEAVGCAQMDRTGVDRHSATLLVFVRLKTGRSMSLIGRRRWTKKCCFGWQESPPKVVFRLGGRVCGGNDFDGLVRSGGLG